MDADLSTSPEDPPGGWTRFDRVLRGVTFTVVFAVVGLAVLGAAGLRTREAHGASADLAVTVTYAQVTRGGLATPLSFDIRSSSGDALPERLDVSVSTDYLAMFDENGRSPAPERETADGERRVWTFEPGGASHLRVELDARLQPNVHSGQTGVVEVVGPGVDAVSVRFRTWVWP